MVFRGSRDIDNLAAESVDKRSVLTLRIYDNNICARCENDIYNITLCKERFTAAGYTEDESVTVKESAIIIFFEMTF